ncbi:hypothetical protein VULLAG_LOCUS8366 [Vulpes lagopus]
MWSSMLRASNIWNEVYSVSVLKENINSLPQEADYIDGGTSTLSCSKKGWKPINPQSILVLHSGAVYDSVVALYPYQWNLPIANGSWNGDESQDTTSLILLSINREEMEGWAERKGQWPQNGLQLCNDGTNEGLIEKANDVPMIT